MPIELFSARYQVFRPRMGVPVRTTITPPRWKLPYELTHKIMQIAPDRAYIRAPKSEFRRRYFEKLNSTGPAGLIAIMERIAEIENDGRLVLLCYEDLTKPDLWCHRTLFGEWWENKTGNPVREIAAAEPVKARPVQGRLL